MKLKSKLIVSPPVNSTNQGEQNEMQGRQWQAEEERFFFSLSKKQIKKKKKKDSSKIQNSKKYQPFPGVPLAIYWSLHWSLHFQTQLNQTTWKIRNQQNKEQWTLRRYSTKYTPLIQHTGIPPTYLQVRIYSDTVDLQEKSLMNWHLIILILGTNKARHCSVFSK